MAVARSNKFNADMNQDLLKLIEGFQYDPYGVRAISGYRPGDVRQHGRGTALDIELTDPRTGQPLGGPHGNYQDPSTFSAYQQYANALYQHALKTNPQLAQQLRWGGYFSGPKGKYGAMDLMHFDVGGGAMGGGSWQGGLNPDQAALWNLQPGGGVGGAGGAMQGPPAATQVADYLPEQRRNAIASIESAGSGDYAAQGPITNRQGDRAYGRYQIMGSNIPAWSKAVLGREVTVDEFLKDPKIQDAIFDAQFGDYVKKYGEQGAAEAWFGGPGNVGKKGAEDILGTNVGGYGSKYMAALGKAGGQVTTPGAATVQPGGSQAPATAVAGGTTKDSMDKYTQAATDAIGGFADMKAPVMGAGGRAPQLPTMAPTALDPVPITAPGVDDARRNQLAMLMQRLNTKTLWG